MSCPYIDTGVFCSGQVVAFYDDVLDCLESISNQNTEHFNDIFIQYIQKGDERANEYAEERYFEGQEDYEHCTDDIRDTEVWDEIEKEILEDVESILKCPECHDNIDIESMTCLKCRRTFELKCKGLS